MLQTNIFSNYLRTFRFTPTHHVVINLVKARKHENCVEAVDEIVAEKTFHSFRRALTKRCVSRAHYQRFNPVIDAVASVERSKDMRFHLHMMLRKPVYLTEAGFERHIRETARNNPYVMKQDRYTVNITELSELTEDHVKNTKFYVFKQIDQHHSAFLM